MKRINLPQVNSRYWVAILAASMLGTTFGDVVSLDWNLGYASGLMPLALVLAVIFLAERWSSQSCELYYWAAIVITRTAATNLSDLATHEMKYNYIFISLILVVILLATLLPGRKLQPQMLVTSKELPPNDLRYWAAILIASTLGTTLGDYVSGVLNFGVGGGSLILGSILLIYLFIIHREKLYHEIYYWFAIVIVRMTGTTMGDFLSSSDGLNLGFTCSALMVTLVLIAVLFFWRVNSQSQIKQNYKVLR